MWTAQPTPETAEQLQQRQSQPFKAAGPGPAVEEKRAVAWIGKSVIFKGELLSSEDMRIEGRVEGTIELRNHDLVIGPGAVIQADVIAKTIMVLGTVTGTLMATDRIKICETASIDGDITAPRLAIIEGATIKGRLHTTGQEEAAAPRAKLAAAV
jgi:cytoskeletal protein CcmA (bactofilin family)